MTLSAIHTADLGLSDEIHFLSPADKVRRGRLAALASLRAKAARSENVVSIFDNVLPVRETVPVFRSRRAAPPKHLPRLLLTNPVAA